LGCTLAELGERMSLDEFHLWETFDAESPLPDLRSDIQNAHVVSSVMNMGGKTLKKNVSLTDALLFQPRKEEKRMDVLDQLRGR
jgi:hypothetical protein